RDELETQPLLDQRFEQQLGVVLPRVDGEHLQLWQVDSGDELEKGPFRLLEPSQALPEARRVAPEDIDLIFVPGLAFDERGGRLGYGKGHYDRLLSRLSAEVPRVGLCFEEQIVAAVPVEEHDVAMTHLGTPERVVVCRRE
ncbi:MAG: 5-formyltetrahydrofolate cyclo-ligase, partial [Acidobacteriota bacterium]